MHHQTYYSCITNIRQVLLSEDLCFPPWRVWVNKYITITYSAGNDAVKSLICPGFINLSNQLSICHSVNISINIQLSIYLVSLYLSIYHPGSILRFTIMNTIIICLSIIIYQYHCIYLSRTSQLCSYEFFRQVPHFKSNIYCKILFS